MHTAAHPRFPMAASPIMPKPIDWGSLYRGFSAAVTRIDCGALCAKRNKAVPVCCNNRRHIPLLFRDELRWHIRHNGGMWRKRTARTKLDKKQAAECANYLEYCLCIGAEKCRRAKRSLTCRFFPFEPYIAEDGVFVGITYMYRAAKDCPLIDNPDILPTKAYVRQSIKTWERIFKRYPAERELFYEVSRALERSQKRKRRGIKVFAA